MDEYIKSLWKNNKLLFFVLLPLVIIIFFRDVILGLLVDSVRKDVQEADKKDSKLKSEFDKINNEANRIKAEADELGKKADEVDEDWHKKD